jgi:hypothetical protein
MAAPPEIVNLSRQYIAEKVIPFLTPEVGAVCLEIIAWHIQVHTYQYAVFSDQSSEALDIAVDELALTLPTREGEPWQSTLAWHRREPGEPLRYEGEVVYERWSEL